jgi:flagellar protein FlaG
VKIGAVDSRILPPSSPTSTEPKPESAVAVKTDIQKESYPKHLVKAVEGLNKDAEAANRQVRFALYKDTHRIMIEVLDKDTNQVVSTFPPKQILALEASFEEERNRSNDGREVK